MNSEDMIQILIDIGTGVAPETEDKEHAAMRDVLTAEVEAIKSSGGIVEISPEIP